MQLGRDLRILTAIRSTVKRKWSTLDSEKVWSQSTLEAIKLMVRAASSSSTMMKQVKRTETSASSSRISRFTPRRLSVSHYLPYVRPRRIRMATSSVRSSKVTRQALETIAWPSFWNLYAWRDRRLMIVPIWPIAIREKMSSFNSHSRSNQPLCAVLLWRACVSLSLLRLIGP